MSFPSLTCSHSSLNFSLLLWWLFSYKSFCFDSKKYSVWCPWTLFVSLALQSQMAIVLMHFWVTITHIFSQSNFLLKQSDHVIGEKVWSKSVFAWRKTTALSYQWCPQQCPNMKTELFIKPSPSLMSFLYLILLYLFKIILWASSSRQLFASIWQSINK